MLTSIKFVTLALLALTVLYPLTEAIHVDISCDQGWIQSSNSCYFWNNYDRILWSEAHEECHSRGADMLVIHNQDEQNWVSIQTEEYSTDGWWIGLRYQDSAFHWVHDKTLSTANINWNQEPDNYDDQDCVSINEFARVSDESCFSKYAFICKVNKTQDQDCPSQASDQRWAFLDTACYWISDPADPAQLKTWEAARKACAAKTVNNLPMDLLAINFQQELLFFQTELPQRSNDDVATPWWIGLNDKANEHFYVWADGSPWDASLTIWDNSPNNDPDESCGLMSAGGVIDDVKCSLRAGYICVKSAVKPALDVGCPDNWLRGGRSCYHLATLDGFTWSQARHYCQNGHGDLLKVDSVSEKYWLTNMHIGDVGYWTGLNDIGHESDWRWADDTTYDANLVKWNHEPNNYLDQEDCAQIFQDGVFNDATCVSKAAYICEYALDPGSTCIPGWLNYANSGCYYISPTNTSQLLMWFEVQQKCLDLVKAVNDELQAFYLALETEAEEKWLIGQLAKLPQTSVAWWTGLSDAAVEGVWLWTTSFSNPPDMSLIKWGGEPNNKGGNENCAVMYQGGRYNDLNCDAKAYFICETAADTSRAGRQGVSHLFVTFILMLSCVTSAIFTNISPFNGL